MAVMYDIKELSTALKPWALELLLDRGATVATYLDPDIVLYAGLDEVERLAIEHDIVLTPHNVGPIPVTDGGQVKPTSCARGRATSASSPSCRRQGHARVVARAPAP